MQIVGRGAHLGKRARTIQRRSGIGEIRTLGFLAFGFICGKIPPPGFVLKGRKARTSGLLSLFPILSFFLVPDFVREIFEYK